MTADMTFKEFVEARNINYCLLKFGSQEYRELVEAFNRAKFKIEADEEATEWANVRARLSDSGTPWPKAGRFLNNLPQTCKHPLYNRKNRLIMFRLGARLKEMKRAVPLRRP